MALHLLGVPPPWLDTGAEPPATDRLRMQSHAHSARRLAPLCPSQGCSGKAVLWPSAGGDSLALRARAVSAPWALGNIFPRLPTLARPRPAAGTTRPGRAGCFRPDGLTATGVGICATQRLAAADVNVG
jgi:hypothetical protein